MTKIAIAIIAFVLVFSFSACEKPDDNIFETTTSLIVADDDCDVDVKDLFEIAPDTDVLAEN